MSTQIPSPTLSVLHRQLAERKRVNVNVHHLAEAMFKPGAKVEFEAGFGDRKRKYFGECVAVCGIAGTTRLRVRNLSTLKEREIELYQVTGLVKEE
jgi:hypothetical protein